MREIKFKIWNLEKKQWENVLRWAIAPEDGSVIDAHESGVFTVAPFSYEMVQYTGLKDKNGKEIYEGDIIGIEDVYHFIERDGWKPKEGNWKIIGKKSRNFTRKEAGEEKYIAGYRLKVVRWEEGSCGFEPFSDSEENCGHCGGGDNPNSFEVLGNIYENPELLEEVEEVEEIPIMKGTLEALDKIMI